jgi:hypothetical protein
MNNSLRLAEIAKEDDANRLDAVDDGCMCRPELGDALFQGRTALNRAAKHLVKSVVHS